MTNVVKLNQLSNSLNHLVFGSEETSTSKQINVFAPHSIYHWRAKKRFASIGFPCGTLSYSTPIYHGLKLVAIYIEPLWGSV
jgi:hypothetical protein